MVPLVTTVQNGLIKVHSKVTFVFMLVGRNHLDKQLDLTRHKSQICSLNNRLLTTDGWRQMDGWWMKTTDRQVKKGSPYSITKRGVPELILVLGSQPAGDVSHKPDGRLPLLSTRPAVTPATLKRAATNFAAWWTEAQWVWVVCLRLLPDSIAAAIWTQAFLSPAR